MGKKRRKTSWLNLTIEVEKDTYETRLKSSRRLRADTIAIFLAELECVKKQTLDLLLKEAPAHITMTRKHEERMFG